MHHPRRRLPPLHPLLEGRRAVSENDYPPTTPLPDSPPPPPPRPAPEAARAPAGGSRPAPNAPPAPHLGGHLPLEEAFRSFFFKEQPRRFSPSLGVPGRCPNGCRVRHGLHTTVLRTAVTTVLRTALRTVVNKCAASCSPRRARFMPAKRPTCARHARDMPPLTCPSCVPDMPRMPRARGKRKVRPRKKCTFSFLGHQLAGAGGPCTVA